ncbi:crotonobetaine/carnitine-CoA ligase [Desulfatibacillum alkenivorans DSM 16219]|jgi:crotonobetaine/carnitine-CoA ligase|uniref:Crotonobetaine/carnitine-CoA ligase n=1 Tax=Desulfatibacillum alkenivorans DSM 16219 TaxID=1121393 RepID=A0A1M6YNY0_9BACT|nr:AMP-binding protein [Desulfatibacillum alkenivorans]SHL19917.1 crotonobetaine/carnitine-CoA ligase [Desulfatibacillum alkenivorans DSM 16219]
MPGNLESLPIFQLVGAKDIDPDKTAYIFVRDDGSDEVISYGALFDNVNRMSRVLKGAGIGKGDAFALIMRNHAEFLYALFGALSIGAVAVPVDPRSVGRKLSFQINNTKCKGVIVEDNLVGSIREVESDIQGAPVIGVLYKNHHGVAPMDGYPALNEVLAAQSPDLPDDLPPLDFAAPAQIIHTSGTTGDPKGVVLKADRYMIYSLLGQIIWQYDDSDVLYTGLSMTHGNAQSVTVIPSLAKGIPAVVSERFTKSKLWDICRKYGCTSYSLLGGMMAGIYNEPPKENDADNPVVRVISAGTPLAIWEAFEKRFNVKIHEWYGAVEGGLAHQPPGTGPVGSFGKPPEALIEMKVVDENDEEVPPGHLGELVSRMKSGETTVEYYGKKEASAEKTRGGWLRSGDICHTDKDGNFYFDFRKGGGLRRQGDFIQPDYVERIIGEHETVSEVCVYGIPASTGAPGESDLVAAIAPFEGGKVDVEAVKALCLEKLEKNAVPSYFQLVDEIPKTISEKALDRVLKDNFAPGADNVTAVF